VDWDYLESINSDVVGWLYCPNTVINYPVVQTNDHQFYLTHGFDGESNTSGTLFADMNSVEGIVQSNYIIYGHNMKDDSMFGSFQEYSSQSYYEQHPTLYYLTPYGNYRIDLFCAHIVEATDDNYPGYFSSTADYQSYLNKVTSSAFWVNYDVISTDYQLLTMSTCTSAAGYSDPRLLVQGVMVPIQ
jgi:sortase B